MVTGTEPYEWYVDGEWVGGALSIDRKSPLVYSRVWTSNTTSQATSAC